MKIWDDIVTAALIGTERQSFTPPAPGGALGEALSGVSAETPEARLLGCAALASTYRRAEIILPKHPEAIPTAPEEDRNAYQPVTERHLLALLGGENEMLKSYTVPLLREWLAAVAHAGRLAPSCALPLLLDAGKRTAALRPVLAPLLGMRGAWLARLNPEWAYAGGAAVEDGEAAWTDGTLEVRTEFLRRERQADPAAARERLAATWEQEPIETRKVFLEVLADNLSAADEPFLEAALGDRGRTVRQAAGALLCVLPGSQYIQRMTERARRCMWIGKKVLGGEKIVVELPEKLDAAARRDGLGEHKSMITEDLGRKGALLWQIIALTPLEHWTPGSGLEPCELIGLARETEWAAAIVGGWAEAARRQRNIDWSQALLEKYKYGAEYELDPLLQFLDQTRLEHYIIEALRQDSKHRLKILDHILSARCNILSAEATRVILPELKKILTNGAYDERKPNVLMAVALCGAPCCYPEANAMALEINASQSTWVNTLKIFLAVYELRHILHKEFEQ